MKKIKYSLIFLILLLWLISVIRINLKYPNAANTVYKVNESIEYNEFEINVSKMEFLDEARTKELFADEIERFGDCRCVLVYITVKNNGSEKRRIELYPFILESDAWKNSIMMSVYQEINEEYIKEGKVTLQPEIDAYGTYECILTYSIAKTNFTQEQWEGVENRKFDLVLTLYPVKRSVELQ